MKKITGSKCRIRTWKTRGKVVQISAQVHSIRLLGKGAVFAADVLLILLVRCHLAQVLLGRGADSWMQAMHGVRNDLMTP